MDEVFGLPTHALVVHGAVVLTPLAAFAAIAFAVFPQWRYLTRWPTALLALAATGSVWVARLTGESLQEERALPQQLVDTHESRGEVLALMTIGFVVVVLFATRMLGGPSGLVSGKGEVARGAAWVESVVPAAVVLVSVVTVIWVVLTGDAGARAVWG